MAKQTTPSNVLLGLLECPFRKGYIEFEYEIGDTAAELRKRIADMWGSPVALGEWYRGGFFDEGRWAILCEDEAGAYFSLRDDDEIPIRAPKASSEVIEPIIDREQEQRWRLPKGLIYIRDIGRRRSHERHLRLELHREYEIPKDKMYSVKLIALIVITGG